MYDALHETAILFSTYEYHDNHGIIMMMHMTMMTVFITTQTKKFLCRQQLVSCRLIDTFCTIGACYCRCVL